MNDVDFKINICTASLCILIQYDVLAGIWAQVLGERKPRYSLQVARTLFFKRVLASSSVVNVLICLFVVFFPVEVSQIPIDKDVLKDMLEYLLLGWLFVFLHIFIWGMYYFVVFINSIRGNKKNGNENIPTEPLGRLNWFPFAFFCMSLFFSTLLAFWQIFIYGQGVYLILSW